ncbi:MAG: hypothetical protein ACTHLH_06160 [Solirubrobacterales bacterium]
MLPLAAAETWWGVLGGLIPIIGLALVSYIIYRAVKDDGNDDQSQ